MHLPYSYLKDLNLYCLQSFNAWVCLIQQQIQYLQRSEYWTHHRTSIQLVLSLGLMFIFLMISLKIRC
ncbi:hypothetical protein ZEAMMB73_Zm00001d033832 [Zea mays]|uniref:Uncharacterized protein n=1 Tax=Zea mays TaxID=4577 RepID=A0A1D6L2Q5_MAIZE|nr:hypothetical protein ZEAMMB73_Zm00001d033832 [Zea mays]ONM08739.1 hypothetical protein ZEAMMB73_Zm00001d033832 [Zea mays]